MNERENAFRYTYSAQEQSEIEYIRNKYMPQEESALDRLRKLDRSATQKAQMYALTLGVIGVLVLGAGMSLFLSDLGAIIGLSAGFALAVGIAGGSLGLIMVALAYPVYNRVLANHRRRIAPEILRLTEELMK